MLPFVMIVPGATIHEPALNSAMPAQ